MEREIGFDRTQVGFWKSEGFAKPPTEGAGDFLSGVLGKRWGKVAQELLLQTLEANLPSVFDFIDEEWDASERKLVLDYVKHENFRDVSYLGDSTCRMCGKMNGSADFDDGAFTWPEGLAHYIADHRVRPPQHFVRHVLKRAKAR